MKQTRLPAIWLANNDELSDSDEESFEPDSNIKKKNPLYWTRVKSMDQIRCQKVMVYDADKDMEFDKNLRLVRREINQALGRIVFDPDEFKGRAQVLTIDQTRLTHEKLFSYGKIATNLREIFGTRA